MKKIFLIIIILMVANTSFAQMKLLNKLAEKAINTVEREIKKVINESTNEKPSETDKTEDKSKQANVLSNKKKIDGSTNIKNPESNEFARLSKNDYLNVIQKAKDENKFILSIVQLGGGTIHDQGNFFKSENGLKMISENNNINSFIKENFILNNEFSQYEENKSLFYLENPEFEKVSTRCLIIEPNTGDIIYSGQNIWFTDESIPLIREAIRIYPLLNKAKKENKKLLVFEHNFYNQLVYNKVDTISFKKYLESTEITNVYVPIFTSLQIGHSLFGKESWKPVFTANYNGKELKLNKYLDDKTLSEDKDIDTFFRMLLGTLSNKINFTIAENKSQLIKISKNENKPVLLLSGDNEYYQTLLSNPELSEYFNSNFIISKITNKENFKELNLSEGCAFWNPMFGITEGKATVKSLISCKTYEDRLKYGKFTSKEFYQNAKDFKLNFDIENKKIDKNTREYKILGEDQISKKFNFDIIEFDNSISGLDKIISESKRNGKKLILYLKADWEGRCELLEKKVFNDNIFIDLMTKNFSFVWFEPEKEGIDRNLGDKIMTKYKINGFPTLLLIDPEENLENFELKDFNDAGIITSKISTWVERGKINKSNQNVNSKTGGKKLENIIENTAIKNDQQYKNTFLSAQGAIDFAKAKGIYSFIVYPNVNHNYNSYLYKTITNSKVQQYIKDKAVMHILSETELKKLNLQANIYPVFVINCPTTGLFLDFHGAGSPEDIIQIFEEISDKHFQKHKH